MRFRKKPIEIEAIQFTGTNAFDIFAFMGRTNDVIQGELHQTDHPIIYTKEGKMECCPGDWVIRGIKGEYYPCKPDIFEATYEAV